MGADSVVMEVGHLSGLLELVVLNLRVIWGCLIWRMSVFRFFARLVRDFGHE